MRGVFDEQELAASRQRRDTELTLGSGTLLAIFFGLVLLCGLCFGMGYAVGHRGPSPAAITAPQPAPDQEPLQASGAIPKPSAIAQTPVAAPANGKAPDAAADQTAATPGTQAAAVPGMAAQPPVNPAAPAAEQIHPALAPGSAPETEPGGSAQTVHSALPAQPQPAQQLMVQIAAVSNPQDADVLVGALRNRGYAVSARRDPVDNFIHVRIGPFATRAIAEQWRLKLLNDGYNAIIQP